MVRSLRSEGSYRRHVRSLPEVSTLVAVKRWNTRLYYRCVQIFCIHCPSLRTCRTWDFYVPISIDFDWLILHEFEQLIPLSFSRRYLDYWTPQNPTQWYSSHPISILCAYGTILNGKKLASSKYASTPRLQKSPAREICSSMAKSSSCCTRSAFISFAGTWMEACKCCDRIRQQ